MSIKEQLIGYAKKIEIDVIGFCSAEPFEEIRSVLADRNQRGYLSGMEEKDLEKRIDPRRTMESAKTMIVIGEGYYTQPNGRKQESLSGRISQSAWGRDYHILVRDKLMRLGQYLQSLTEAAYQAFADTGPLVDREVAKRAGIGWQGKHCGVISPKLGSWMFIGYLLTDIEIEPDIPMTESLCGDCNLCQLVCPTGALCNPYELQAKICVSYLTQSKEELEPELMEKMGQQIYGCDRCQRVCPYNKEVLPKQYTHIEPALRSGHTPVADLLQMTNEEFRNTFGQSAAGWRGKKILQRNAVIALGNSGKKEALAMLQTCMRDERPLIRKTAAWAVGRLGFEEGIRILSNAWEREKDQGVQEVLRRALEKLNKGRG